MRPRARHTIAAGWHDPPDTLRHARLDNIALVPASMLPFKEEWQRVANEMPEGGVLISLPAENEKLRAVVRRIEQEFVAAGYVVKELGPRGVS